VNKQGTRKIRLKEQSILGSTVDIQPILQTAQLDLWSNLHRMTYHLKRQTCLPDMDYIWEIL
jgi:hypothetical protein